MQKQKAIELLGGTIAAAAEAIGISYQAVKQWPEELPPRIADRVYAVWGRKNMPASDQPTSPTPVAETAHGLATNTTPDATEVVTPPDMDDHRSHSLRRVHADSPYDHTDIDRRAEEGPTHLGRRASNGHPGDAVDVVAKGA